MSQIEDEYELRRDGVTYQLIVEYEYAHYPLDDEGCPVMPPGAPLVDVTKAEILATWPEASEATGSDEGLVEYAGPDYPQLDPPMTEAELRVFDEHLADRAAGAAEEAHEHSYERRRW
jgi:hypothetical protein